MVCQKQYFYATTPTTNQQIKTLNTQTKFDPFAGPKIAHILHITESQQELWHSCLFGGEDANRAYNESLSLVFNGSLDYNALEKSFQELIQRHESLRAVFSPDGKYMCVLEELKFEIEFQDFSDFSETEKIAQTNYYLRQDASLSFDLVRGPLIRAGLLKLNDEKHQLVITAHHIICDGWSFGIILQELGNLYSANVQNSFHDLPEPIAYSQYAEEQRAFLENGAIEKVENYWLDLYAGKIPELNLPTDQPRPDQRTYSGNRYDQSLNTKLITRLKSTGAKANCSLVVTLMTAFEIFLYEITGQKSFALGLPTAGQSAIGAKHLIGHCVNLLPLHSNIDLESNFIEQLQKRKLANFDAFENQELTFGRLLQKLKVKRNSSRIPLVPVVINIDMGIDDDVSFYGLTYELISNPREYETFELFLNATGSEHNLILEWSYNSNLFEKTSIETMAKSFEALLQKLIAKPEVKIADLTSKKLPSYQIKGEMLPYPKSTLHELFNDQASNNPEALALQSDTENISYGDLQKRINQTAHFLRKKGVHPNHVVAISLDRSPELIIAIFAVLQCGASYVPIDTNYPEARVRLMVTDSLSTFFITNSINKIAFNSVNHIHIDAISNESCELESTPLEIEVPSESPAYIIYTSGSTGKPKGVQVAHKNVINLVISMGKEPGIGPKDKIFAITTISFDATVMEIFLPLLHGASVVFVDEETRRDGHLLLQKAVKDEITVVWGTPTIYQILLDSGWKNPLPIKALIGGEPVPRSLAHELIPRCGELWNIYGPTETTVCALLTRISVEDNPITVGRPVANTHVYLLDEEGNIVPEGEEGEIVIGGDGVSLGYLNRPELTERSFVADTFQEENERKMYRSGDIGKLRPNGQIECLGRRDRQVKVRGHRIELGEIEHVLKKLPGVNAAVTEVENNFLKAYIVPSINNGDLEGQVDAWKQQLTSELPIYMVPQEFIFLEELPITSSGKLDRKKLSQLNSSNSTDNSELENPRTKTEKLIADIWKECLSLQKVGTNNSFFDLGGHSLVAARVMTELEEKTGKRLPLASLFEHSTIEKLALLIDKGDRDLTWDSLVPIRRQGSKPPIFMVHGAGLNVLNFNSLANNMDSDQPVFGLQAKGLEGTEELLTSVEEIAAYYNKIVIESHPEGPYSIAGYSFGGVIAYEMASQLTDQGKQVSLLGLFDTYAFPAYGYKTKQGKKVGDFKFFVGQKIHTLKHMFGSIEGFKFRTTKYLKMLQRLFLCIVPGKKISTEVVNERVIEIMRANNRAIKSYHLKPARIKVDLFRAKRLDEYVHDPTYMGWKPFALDGIEIHEVPGDHYSIFSSPNDVVFAKVLQEVLDRNHSDI